MVGTLEWVAVNERLDLVAPPVAAALTSLPSEDVKRLQVAAIDPNLADTAAFCQAYDIGLDISANCVIVAAKRAGERTLAACMVLATTRADVNGVVRRHLEARKTSFAPMDTATAASDMEFGGITPIGLPATWPVLVDGAVAQSDVVVIGSGLRRSKLLIPGEVLARLPGAQVLDALAVPVSSD